MKLPGRKTAALNSFIPAVNEKKFVASRMNRLLIVTSGLVCLLLASSVAAQAPVIDLSTGKGAGRQANSESLEMRVEKLERILENKTLLDMNMRIESLQQEVQKLVGQMEVESHNIEELKKRQRNLYLDIDRRMQRLEGGSSSSGAVGGIEPALPGTGGTAGSGQPTGESGAVGMVSPPMGAATGEAGTSTSSQAGAAGAGSESDRAAYQDAFNLLRQGKYDQASTALKNYVAQHPNSEYADNAQYWLGEVSYVQRNFEVALSEFNKVITNYPNSPKYADALLKIGLTQYELQHWDQAKKVFNELMSRYPNTAGAQIAEKRLQRIQLEGH
jgi:tol-pal system protein YbgF